jgi:hypothetical protein
MNKHYIVGMGLVLGMVVLTAVGVGVAHADTQATNQVSKMAQVIADKFHLNASDVQSTMNTEHQAMIQDHQAAMKAKLDQAVKDGKLTQSQETTLLQKLQVKAEDRESFRQSRQDLRTWLDSQKIDLRSILDEPAGMGHMGMMQGS